MAVFIGPPFQVFGGLASPQDAPGISASLRGIYAQSEGLFFN